VIVDTSQIADRSDKYDVVLACGIIDPTVDQLEDKRIILSSPFNIAAGPQAISAPSTDEFTKFATTLDNGPISFWQRVFIVPKDLDLTKVHRLSDVPKLGGRLY
jgi:hypothetical protein